MVTAVFAAGNIEVENEAHGVVVEKKSSSSSAGVVCRSVIEVNIVSKSVVVELMVRA